MYRANVSCTTSLCVCTDISFFFTELHILPSRRNHEDGLRSLRHGRLSCGRSCGSAVSLRCCGSPLALASSANDATTDRRRFPLISQTTAQQHNIPNLPLKYIRPYSGRTQGYFFAIDETYKKRTDCTRVVRSHAKIERPCVAYYANVVFCLRASAQRP